MYFSFLVRYNLINGVKYAANRRLENSAARGERAEFLSDSCNRNGARGRPPRPPVYDQEYRLPVVRRRPHFLSHFRAPFNEVSPHRKWLRASEFACGAGGGEGRKEANAQKSLIENKIFRVPAAYLLQRHITLLY